MTPDEMVPAPRDPSQPSTSDGIEPSIEGVSQAVSELRDSTQSRGEKLQLPDFDSGAALHSIPAPARIIKLRGSGDRPCTIDARQPHIRPLVASTADATIRSGAPANPQVSKSLTGEPSCVSAAASSTATSEQGTLGERHPIPPVLPVSDVLAYTVPESEHSRLETLCTERRAAPITDLKFPHDPLNPPWVSAAFQSRGRVLIAQEVRSLQQAWFVGDVHGDLVGLIATLETIPRLPEYLESDCIVLLGDLIDDLPESEQVLAEVASRMARGEHLLFIPGNHDAALEFTGEHGFRATVSPSDYCDELRRFMDGSLDHPKLKLAKSFVNFVKCAPVALFLSDGTVAAHGGVPHSDLLSKLETEGWESDAEITSDFIWARLHPRAKRRMAVGGTRSRELGAENFTAFADAARATLGFRPLQMIRGHDHIEERLEVYADPWKESIVTINNMSWSLPRESGTPGPRNPCVVRWQRGKPLQPIRIQIDPLWRTKMQPEPAR